MESVRRRGGGGDKRGGGDTWKRGGDTWKSLLAAGEE